MPPNVWDAWKRKKLEEAARERAAQQAREKAAYEALSQEQTPITDQDRVYIEKLRTVRTTKFSSFDKSFIRSVLKASALSDRQRHWLPILVQKYRRQIR